MIYGPVRPDLSLSMDPDACDFIEIDLDRRTVRVRLSGVRTPVLKYDDGVEESYGAENVPGALFGPLIGGFDRFATKIENEFHGLVKSGIRSFRKGLPRGTLTGSGLDYIADFARDDPLSSTLDELTLDRYLRLHGMRRSCEAVVTDWCRLEKCRISREHPMLEPYPALTAPGAGFFLS